MKFNYSTKWVLQRVTALFLIPLTFWFIYQCISFQDYQYEEMQLFFKSYFNSLLFTGMMIIMLIHAKLGCETIIKDYVSSIHSQKICNNLINFITTIALILVIGSIFKLNII